MKCKRLDCAYNEKGNYLKWEITTGVDKEFHLYCASYLFYELRE